MIQTPMANERSTSFILPQGPLSLDERIKQAHARVRNASILYELFPCELYRIALEARRKELEELQWARAKKLGLKLSVSPITRMGKKSEK